mmetsp:Transcript_41872/g.64096  ORF Transcript_41872/g.64096 Transcript_41872/m.64096 type:complete len:83 (-) Transcript_41872:3113-3361(-)
MLGSPPVATTAEQLAVQVQAQRSKQGAMQEAKLEARQLLAEQQQVEQPLQAVQVHFLVKQLLPLADQVLPRAFAQLPLLPPG